MQRYADAGLNPNLIYGQGSNGNATSSPSYNTPTMQGARVYPVAAMSDAIGQIGSVLGQFANLRLTEAQAAAAFSQAAKNDADAATSRANANFINSKTSYQDAFNAFLMAQSMLELLPLLLITIIFVVGWHLIIRWLVRTWPMLISLLRGLNLSLILIVFLTLLLFLL